MKSQNMDTQVDDQHKINEPRHENKCLRVCDQVRLKPACSATEARKSLEFSDKETRDIILSRQRITEVLTRLRGCVG